METWRATSGGTDAPHGKLRVDLDVRNRLAFATLVLAKIVGVAGLVIGVTSHRLVGGVLLGLDAVLLVTALGMCVRAMRGQQEKEAGQKEVLSQMVREGTLEQFLRDLREEELRRRAEAETERPSTARLAAAS